MITTVRQSCCRAARTVAMVCIVLSRETAGPVRETGQRWSSARAQSGFRVRFARHERFKRFSSAELGIMSEAETVSHVQLPAGNEPAQDGG